MGYVLFRKDPDAVTTDTETVPEPEAPSAPGKKGRPTPKRRDQEAARRRPLVPADRKQAKRDARANAREARLKQRAAFNRGDESALPARDRGPEKRYIRNVVDSRWNIGEIILPLMLVMLVLTLMPNPTIQRLGLYLVWVVVVLGALDSLLLWRRLKKQIREKFHEAPPRGCASYAVMRSFQMRMARMPKPQVKRGEKVS